MYTYSPFSKIITDDVQFYDRWDSPPLMPWPLCLDPKNIGDSLLKTASIHWMRMYNMWIWNRTDMFHVKSSSYFLVLKTGRYLVLHGSVTSSWVKDIQLWMTRYAQVLCFSWSIQTKYNSKCRNALKIYIILGIWMNISFWATKFQTINEINSYRSQIEGLVPLLEDL